MATMTERVRNGAAYLDGIKPGWWKKIKASILDMGNCYTCIGGQLFSNFWSIPEVKKLSEDYSGHVETWAQDNGFDCEDVDQFPGGLDKAYEKLTATWLKEIDKRAAKCPTST
jgi:hypothetical protein